MRDLWQIEAIGIDDNVASPCRGDVDCSVRGIVRYEGLQIAIYAVHWTRGLGADHGAHFDLIVDSWRDDTARIEQCSISLACRLVYNRPLFSVIDSADRDIAKSALVSCPLNRADLIGDPLVKDIITICDVIAARDGRIAELLKRSNRKTPP